MKWLLFIMGRTAVYHEDIEYLFNGCTSPGYVDNMEIFMLLRHCIIHTALLAKIYRIETSLVEPYY